MHALAKCDASAARAATFLGSWSLELLLKAHLARVGKHKKELRPIQHNLEALWELSVSTGLAVAGTPPSWCKDLSATHNHPFVQRYDSEDAAWTAPNMQLLLGELTALQAVVRRDLT